jgi:hypothetical protein
MSPSLSDADVGDKPHAAEPSLKRLSIVTPREMGINLGAWEMFQHPRFLDIYASHYGWRVLAHHGVLIFARSVPGLGLMRTQVYSPEAGGGAQWHRILRDLPAGRIEVMTNAPAPESLARPTSPPDLHSLIIDLRPGIDDLFASFESRTRKAIRRAEREGMTVGPARDLADLDAFHALLMRVTRGGTVYQAPDLSLLHAITRGGFSRLYVARHGGQIVGGAFLLTNRYSHGFVSCFDPQACGGLPGNLLYWGVIQGEIEAGMPFLDLGAQSLSQQPGLTMAKRSFSPFLLPAYRYELTPSPWRARVGDVVRRFRRSSEPAPPAPTKETGEPG